MWFVVVALGLLIPASGSRLRRWTLASLNLGFLLLYSRPGQPGSLAYVLAAALACWVFVHLLARPGIGRPAALAGGQPGIHCVVLALRPVA